MLNQTGWCPSDSFKIGNDCFTVFDTELSFNNARQICKEQNGRDLASFTSQTQIDYLLSKLGCSTKALSHDQVKYFGRFKNNFAQFSMNCYHLHDLAKNIKAGKKSKYNSNMEKNKNLIIQSMSFEVWTMTPNCHTLKKTSKKCDNLGSWTVIYKKLIKKRKSKKN